MSQEKTKRRSKLSNTIASEAKRIGANIDELINSVTVFARLGYSLEDSTQLASLTTEYSKVAGVGVDEATTNVTGIIKAYKTDAENLELIFDKLIYVGNKYPISSAQIGEGMNNAASALAATGNSLNQALGLLSAANTTVQNIDKASTALRTIAARLSASKAQLDDIGEDATGVETVAKLQESFAAFGISISKGNGELYSTYEIIQQIAARWSQFTDEERSSIAALAAGTRQQDIFYSLVGSFADAESIVKNIGDATGSLSAATEERLDSIQGRIDQLKATLQDLSQNLLNSGIVKVIASFGGIIVEFVNNLAEFTNGVIIVLPLLASLTLSLINMIKTSERANCSFLDFLHSSKTP